MAPQFLQNLIDDRPELIFVLDGIDEQYELVTADARTVSVSRTRPTIAARLSPATHRRLRGCSSR